MPSPAALFPSDEFGSRYGTGHPGEQDGAATDTPAAVERDAPGPIFAHEVQFAADNQRVEPSVALTDGVLFTHTTPDPIVPAAEPADIAATTLAESDRGQASSSR
jgi:hypothetical protein